MISEEQIYEINIDFAILRELISCNGLENPKCNKHNRSWIKKLDSDNGFIYFYVMQTLSKKESQKFTGVVGK